MSISVQFLFSRLLFLITISGGDIICKLVEKFGIAEHLSKQLVRYMDDLTSAESTPNTELAVNTVVEHLKVTFNISLFYARQYQIQIATPHGSPPPGTFRPSQTISTLG